MRHDEYIDTAAALAKKAGAIIRENFRGDFEKSYKSCPSDLVTEVDRRSEALITRGLTEKFSGHAIVGEEAAGTINNIPDGYAWYIDPLDGTTNFVYGIPFCSVSIGLAYNGKMLAGVVYDPFHDECFTAAAGCGSFLNGRPVKVDPSRLTLREALLVTGYPENKKFNERLRNIDYPKIAGSCSNLRALGSAALELAYISCGRLTGFWEHTLMPWDVAAGSLLVAEAGGKITDIKGKKLTLTSYLSITATNGWIHEELLKILL